MRLYRGIEQLAARQAHNLEVPGSSPGPATKLAFHKHSYMEVRLGWYIPCEYIIKLNVTAFSCCLAGFFVATDCQLYVAMPE